MATSAHIDDSTQRKALRLWPGVTIVALQVLLWLAVPIVGSEAFPVAVIGGFFGGLLVILWWLFFSRAPWPERLGAVVLMILALVATPRALHESVASGNMGAQFFIYAIPTLSLALVLWALVSRRLTGRSRWAALVAAVLLACGVWTLFRSEGLTGDGAAEFTWRWTKTPEERLLASAPEKPAGPFPASEAPKGAIGWPGLRGHNRDGVIPGVRIETDWSASPPVELWRRPIGPGVSSFAVRGDLLYTQEQRGEEEVVTCYNLATGEPVWRHQDGVRFWDAHVGAGPRATPALDEGRLFTLGATGILNALDAGDGTVLWSRNAAADTDAKLPYWGFVSSPLVVGDVVVIHTDELVAYDIATGEPRWFGPASGGSYSSPQLLMLEGTAQILLVSDGGAASVAPTDGSLLWEHAWPGVGIVQPALTADGDVLISMVNNAASPIGIRRISVAHEPGGWTAEERWTSEGLSPSFSAFVVHEGYAYGFDGSILASIDVNDGTRKWKGGRYGQGQLVLLPDQDLLLVLSEQGELALVKASPDGFTELARIPAIEGKTWNQPALVDNVLLVRNGQEMVAFRLSLAGA